MLAYLPDLNHGAIPPSLILISRLGIIKDESAFSECPIPEHDLHAPLGLLKLKFLP